MRQRLSQVRRTATVEADRHARCPGVRAPAFAGEGIGGDGRLKAEFKPNAIPFSVPSRNASGLDTTVVEAAYLIDAALLKGHVSSGVTLCAKNLFGATSINPDWRKNAHDGFPPNHNGSPSYSAFVDFLGHKDLGEKTMLLSSTGSTEARTRMDHQSANGRWPLSTMPGRAAFSRRWTVWRSIRSASIF
ncbi:DUF362 domain-containing protein [Tunturiibacter gelidiferens]|uniref:DUF362 domain-containing protein n=1 Tax=Tunturiibacter gelidiferens TaxID=3069689 RepID=UPI003D9B909B